MIYSKGISWIDDCRIPFVDEKEKEGVCKSDKTKKTYNEDWGNTIMNYKRTGGNNQGRFTPNLLVCDDMLNDGNITSQGNLKLHKMKGGWGESRKVEKNTVEYKGDKGTNSRYYDIDLWFNKLIYSL